LLNNGISLSILKINISLVLLHGVLSAYLLWTGVIKCVEVGETIESRIVGVQIFIDAQVLISL
jgi:hypothetical protein